MSEQVIHLERVKESDLTTIHEWLNSVEAFGEYDEPSFPTAERVRNKWQVGGYDQTLMIRCENESVGFCNYLLHPWDDWIAVIGIVIARPDSRGRGIGTIAHQKLVELILRSNPEVHKVEAYTDVANLAEQRALEKAGFKREGTLRRKNRLKKKFRDLHVYGYLR